MSRESLEHAEEGKVAPKGTVRPTQLHSSSTSPAEQSKAMEMEMGVITVVTDGEVLSRLVAEKVLGHDESAGAISKASPPSLPVRFWCVSGSMISDSQDLYLPCRHPCSFSSTAGRFRSLRARCQYWGRGSQISSRSSHVGFTGACGIQ